MYLFSNVLFSSVPSAPVAVSLNAPKKITLAQSLYNDKNNTIDEICKTLNISRATLYRYIKIGGVKA
jgi:predicted transcriptional regulator YheO